jgi:hypothetical protein
MMNGQAQRSGLVMGLDTHMIAGSRACSTSTRLTHPTITNQTTPHFAGALTADPPSSLAGRYTALSCSSPVANDKVSEDLGAVTDDT